MLAAVCGKTKPELDNGSSDNCDIAACQDTSRMRTFTQFSPASFAAPGFPRVENPLFDTSALFDPSPRSFERSKRHARRWITNQGNQFLGRIDSRGTLFQECAKENRQKSAEADSAKATLAI